MAIALRFQIRLEAASQVRNRRALALPQLYAARGLRLPLAMKNDIRSRDPRVLDPPGPNPHRCMQVGAAAMGWNNGMGVRTFTLAPGTDGTTRFTMREEYTGPLLPLIWRSMPDLGPSFRQFATGLKQRAEQ